MATTSPSSVRELARALGLSHTTVAQALRNNPRVKLQTRKRIHEAAKVAGYQCNHLASTLMTAMRRKRSVAFHGTVALLDLDGADGRPAASAAYHRELCDGACERAEELGLKCDTFTPEQENGDFVADFMDSGRISGALILPVRNLETIANFDWSRCAAVYTDYHEGQCSLNTVSPDHYGAMQMALGRLYALGYRKPGLVLDGREEHRLFNRWGNAFRIFSTAADMGGHLPPLITSDALSRAGFSEWFCNYSPDVVLCHDAGVMQWMRSFASKTSEKIGFVCLNTTKNPDIACSGLDLQPRFLGARGIDQLAGQIYRNEFGVPAQATATIVPALWVDGPSA